MNAKQAERMMKVIDGMQMNMTMSDFKRILGDDLGEHIWRKFTDKTARHYQNLSALYHLLDIQCQKLLAHEINLIYLLVEADYTPLQALEEQHSKYHSSLWMKDDVSQAHVAAYQPVPRR